MKSGDRLGPYEIEVQIGAGGMGEVFRAKDTRLGREVAIKILPSAFKTDPDRMRRFELEARAAGVLNHPNILSIYDIGMHENIPYAVSELLEGENLRSRLAGSGLPPRKALEFSLQIARGLAAAHEKGIVHRDLKPENLFVTREGRIKILDFGLAKLTENSEGQSASALPTSAQTEPGVILGTAGYMSPEQVRGRIVDHRSDIFTFGAILYEMLTGQRAFVGDSAVETMNAILKQDPPEIKTSGIPAAPAIERIVRHCLEKNPEERFQSAQDLAFALETVSGISSTSAIASDTAQAPAKSKTATILIIMLPLLLIAAAIGGIWIARTQKLPEPVFKRLTFQRGTIYSAQFAPDSRSLLYSANWNATKVQLYQTQPDIPEATSLNVESANILSIAPNGDMLVSIRERYLQGYTPTGTLGSVRYTGGAPRQLMENVQTADWNIKKSDYAVVHNARFLEYPPGKLIYESQGWIGSVRFSPDGNKLAIEDHRSLGDNAGLIVLYDLEKGTHQAITNEWDSIAGLDFHPKTSEIWFSAGSSGNPTQIYALGRNKKLRRLTNIPLNLHLRDISSNGDVLATVNNQRRGIVALSPDETTEKDLSWLDWSFLTDITPDGKQILFMEQAEGVKQAYTVYLRPTDGSPAIRLGDGWSQSLSPNGAKYALVISHPQNDELVLLPTGPGTTKKIEPGGLKVYSWTTFATAERVLFLGSEEGKPEYMYYQDIPEGKPRLITTDRVRFPWAVSPDGRRVAVDTWDGKIKIYPIEGGTSETIEELNNLAPVKWSENDILYLSGRTDVPMQIFTFDFKTRMLKLWKSLAPPDPTGTESVGPVVLAPGANSYAFTYRSVLSDLYLIQGLN